jgi:hypothetical protein
MFRQPRIHLGSGTWNTPVGEPVGPADDGPTVPATFWGKT